MHETIYEKNFKSLLLQAALSAIILRLLQAALSAIILGR